MLRKLTPLFALIVFAAFAATACGGDAEPAPADDRPSPSPPPAANAPAATLPTAPTPGTGPTPSDGPVIEMTVGLNDSGGPGPFFFDPVDLSFNASDTVNFEFVGESQFHTFTVEELGIDVDVGGGETVNFEFTFDTPGTYTLICVPHQALGMVGTITVGESAGAAAPPQGQPLPASPATTAVAQTVDLTDAGGRGPFAFGPADMTFNTGDTVNFEFVGESQFHTFTVEELGIDVEVGGGETVNFEFTFDTPGRYTLICVPHQSLGMVGTITVGGSAGAAAPAQSLPLPAAPAADTIARTVDLTDAGGRGPFAFGPPDLIFNAGDTVDSTLVGESQFHTFTVEALGIDVDVDAGESVSLRFTFDTPGTYELICVPHQALGMVGTITVN